MTPEDELRDAVKRAVADCKDDVVRGWLVSLAADEVKVQTPASKPLAA